MKNLKYHTVGKVLKSIRKIVEKEAKFISLANIYMTSHFPGFV
jgi:hypothetical protein